MIGILDYGMGNLRSVQKAFEYLGAKTLITSDTGALNGCGRLILPGVGSFAEGMKNLSRAGLDSYVFERSADTPILGICLGMQFLLSESEEEGITQGLNFVKGRVTRFTEGKIPHMGWNGVFSLKTPLFEGIPEGTPFYFVHSYFAETDDEFIASKTEYHRTYASAVHAGNVYGVQFHPEKSGEAGLALLRNFMRL